MTKGELLLNWLTHVSEGSWATFRRGLFALEAEDDDDAATARRMRSHLSEMAHVEFFIDGSNRWRTFAPLLSGLSQPPQAVMCGGRTPRLVQALARSCETNGCTIEASEVTDGPDRISVVGPPGALRRAAQGAALSYVGDLASALSSELAPMTAVLGSAPAGAAPTNWSLRSFDLRELRWVDGLLPDTAYEYRSRHGGLRHYVRGPGRALLSLDRRMAVYAAAHMNRIPLLSYDAGHRKLMVPKGAPLPDTYARVAAACAGAPGVEEGGQIIYGDVPPRVAGVLMLAAGQRPPEPNWMAGDPSAC